MKHVSLFISSSILCLVLVFGLLQSCSEQSVDSNSPYCVEDVERIPPGSTDIAMRIIRVDPTAVTSLPQRITLKNFGKTPLDIKGWILTNSRGISVKIDSLEGQKTSVLACDEEVLSIVKLSQRIGATSDRLILLTNENIAVDTVQYSNSKEGISVSFY